MGTEIKLQPGEIVKEVYIMGIRQTEKEDYCIKNNKLIFFGLPFESIVLVTVIKELNIKIKKQKRRK